MQKSQIIQPAAMQTPFAVNGDKNIPSQNASGTDTSSINLGFLPITQDPLPPDGNGQAPERTDFNGLFYLSTDFRVFQQNGGLITYKTAVASAIGGYPKDAILGYLDSNGKLGFVRSLKDDNQVNFVANPAKINNVDWAYSHILNTDADIATLNSTISSVQSNLQGQITTNKNNITTNKNNITALSNSVVKLSGNQSISGQKTFNNAVFVPSSASEGTAISLVERAFLDNTQNAVSCLHLGCGCLLQWGRTTVFTGKNQTKTITLRKRFYNGNSYVVIPNWFGSTNVDDNVQVTSQTATTFTLKSTSAGSNDGTWSLSVNWIAIGRDNS